MRETLRRLLNAPVTTGTVTGIKDGVAEIATPRGRIDAVAPASLGIGDTVQIDNGALLKINRPVSATDTYFV